MINKKNIIIAAVLAGFCTGIPTAEASSNNLLQIDVKRASTADSVDVTFYTTGDFQNTVVTRKSPNHYVVLLPNISGSSSATPTLGGVKDLVTNVQVKNVDDGIGGYTKVTFDTTKPINIKTYMKRTAPLTQAQKDYKNLIAQNNKPTPKVETPHTTATHTQQPVAHQTQAKPQPKPVQQTKTPAQPEKKANNIIANLPAQPKISLISFTPPKVKTTTPKVEPKKTIKPKPQVQQKVVETPKAQKNIETEKFASKVKIDANGRRQIDLEPSVNHKIVAEKPLNKIKLDSIFDIPQETKENEITQNTNTQVQDQPTSVDTPVEKTFALDHLPMWMIISGGVALGLVILFLIFDAATHSTEKENNRLKSFFEISTKKQARRRRREYNDIINNDDLNWQEKYKQYTEKNQQYNPIEQSKDMSYVTDLSATKKAVIEPPKPQKQERPNPINNAFTSDRRNLRNEKLAQNLNSKIEVMPKSIKKEEKLSDSVSAKDFKVVADSIKSIPQNHEEELKNDLRAKISQMEHAFNQTPKIEPPEEISNDVKSEDDAIMKHLSDIKLKSFANSKTLKETRRSLANEDRKINKEKTYKESRFVKLKNSPLSVNRRKPTVSNIEATNLTKTEDNFVINNNINSGEINMDNQKSTYGSASLNEYFSLLDSEESRRASSIAKSPMNNYSGATNPISRGTNPMAKQNPENSRPARYMNGLIVKSGYNIDSEKGFYLVNLEGVSALVGRIKDDIFILKKFDHVIDKQLQVRQDYGSVYIVKAGGYKCLVDVAKDKMGTLIEI